MRTSFREYPPSPQVRDSRLEAYALAIPVVLGCALVLLTGLAYLFGLKGEQYPAAMMCGLVYVMVLLLNPAIRWKPATPLCPSNWALLAFTIHVIIVPFLVVVLGPVQSVLRTLPAESAINLAMLISSLAFAAYAVGYGRPRKDSEARAARLMSSADVGSSRPPGNGIAVTFAAVGVLGIALKFPTLRDFTAFFGGQPDNLVAKAGSTTLREGLAVVLPSFLGFSCLILWSGSLSSAPLGARFRTDAKSQRKIVLTALLAGLGVAAYSTYSYSRASVIVPMVAFAASYSRHVRRLSHWLLLAAAISLLVLATIFGNFRAITYMTEGGRLNLPEVYLEKSRSNVNDVLQIHGAGPQFTGFVIQSSDYGRELFWGQTIFSSLMYSLPVLGKPFRETSGVRMYNFRIYQVENVVDQILPFEAELFWNFHVPGVIVGFWLIAKVLRRIQLEFEGSKTALQTFVYQYLGVWVSFLVVGSLAVIVQVFVYLMWPVYVLAAIPGRRVLRDPTSEAVTP